MPEGVNGAPLDAADHRPRGRQGARRAAAGLFAALVLAVGALTLSPWLPLPQVGLSPGTIQLTGHALAFLALTIIGSAAWEAGLRLVVCLAGLAIGLELGQFLVPGRAPELADAGASLAGIALGWALASGWRRRARPAGNAPELVSGVR